MKVRVTAKLIRECFSKDRILSFGYCEIPNLLHFMYPNYYTCGVYGWNANVYALSMNKKDYMIVTGYRPFGTHIDYKAAESNAGDIVNNYNSHLIDRQEAENRINAIWANLLS